MKSQLAQSEHALSWEPAKPLTGQSPDTEFPLQLLPDTVRKAVTEVEQNVKAPTALVAGAALSAMSVAAQAHFDVKRAARLSGPIGLYMLQIAESGERKTSCDGYFLQPIDEWQAHACSLASKEQQIFEANVAANKAKREGILAAITARSEAGQNCDDLDQLLTGLEASSTEQPKTPKILLVDETPESLASRLSRWPSAAVISSEAGIVFGGHAMNHDAATRNVSQLNALWDGQPLSIGRKTSQNCEVRNARLTIGLQIQPPLFQDFIRKVGPIARGSGFFSRFLMSQPDTTQGSRFFEDPKEHTPALEELHARISQFLNQKPEFHPDGGLRPRTLDFSPEAKEYWIAYHDAIECELSPNGEFAEIRDVASKSAENAARLAAILHAFSDRPKSDITGDTMNSACKIAHWYLKQTQKILATYQPSPDLQDALQLERWLLERSIDGKIAVTRVQQCITPTRLRNKANLERPLCLLESCHRLRRRKIKNKFWIEINPELLG